MKKKVIYLSMYKEKAQMICILLGKYIKKKRQGYSKISFVSHIEKL